jgi:hypothetical protein
VLQKAAQDRAEQVFENAVEEMKKEFEEHKVTKEIDGGIESNNVSGTLRGGDRPENLYSFIGFEAGSTPTDEIRRRLDSQHEDGPKIEYAGKLGQNSLIYKFRVKAPNKEAIHEATPMPWAEGMSWAQKIERGIPGFSRFLARFMGDPSRSGGGIQVDRDIRSAKYSPPSEGYLTTIFNNFMTRIKSYGKRGFRK